MRVAYITEYNSNDLNGFSGLGFWVKFHLEASGCEVLSIGNLAEKPNRIFHALIHRLCKGIGKRYLNDRDFFILRSYGKQLELKLQSLEFDAIVCPGTLPVAFLKTSKPIVTWTDATFGNLLNYYENFSNLSSLSMWSGNFIERRVLNQAARVVFSSDWASESAVHQYGIHRSKVRTIPFGANTSWSFTISEVEKFISLRDNLKCRLLFVGKDWKRKGGDKCLQICDELVHMGVSLQLDIVGVSQPIFLPSYAKNHGFISSSDSETFAKLEHLFINAHFLVLPTIADCVPIVIAEANSVGVPVVSHDTGGISSVVEHSHSGILLSQKTTPYEFAFEIKKVYESNESYKKLALNAYQSFCKKQNWRVNISKFIEVLNETQCQVLPK